MSQLRGVHLEATCHEDEGLPFKCLQCSVQILTFLKEFQGVHEGSVANLAKKPRKGRSDKGVPRGPRGPNIRSKYK